MNPATTTAAIFRQVCADEGPWQWLVSVAQLFFGLYAQLYCVLGQIQSWSRFRGCDARIQ